MLLASTDRRSVWWFNIVDGKMVPRFTEENRKANLAFVDWLKTFAGRRNATPSQIAVAWLLAQKPWSQIEVQGARSPEPLLKMAGR